MDILESLPEMVEARSLQRLGNYSAAIPLLSRSVDIFRSAVGDGAPETRAASRRLGRALYDLGKLQQAELCFAKAGTDSADETSIRVLLDLAKSQLMQGRGGEALTTAAAAVETAEASQTATPDMDALGTALRCQGAIQVLLGEREEAEISLYRGARLCSAPMEEAAGLSLLAVRSFSRGQDGEREAFEYWDAALQSISPESKDAEEKVPTAVWHILAIITQPTYKRACCSVRLQALRARVLCTAAEAELMLLDTKSPQADDARAAERLTEALKLDEATLPSDSPMLGWTLSLAARSYCIGGQAVTSEGLFRSAAAKLDPEDPSGSLALAHHPSPVHPYLVSTFSRASLLLSVVICMTCLTNLFPTIHQLVKHLRMYGDLLGQWDRREAAGEAMLKRASAEEGRLPLHPDARAYLALVHLYVDGKDEWPTSAIA
jgi:tetratricopeptide (TPR) repeat protein